MPGRTLAHLVILSSGEFRGCLLRESATRTTVVPFAGVGHCRRVSNCRRRRPWARFTASGVQNPPCLFVIQGVSGAFERRQWWLHYKTVQPVGRWRMLPLCGRLSPFWGGYKTCFATWGVSGMLFGAAVRRGVAGGSPQQDTLNFRWKRPPVVF